ncbi:MAG: hypothetical protein HC894_10725, partial [Microcoleus sp. SM1_3_4]|nr:hypothetical protein [Microcoleus sp. SM1_3_4]
TPHASCRTTELHVWNVTRGTRLVTSRRSRGRAGSGVICINGAAAHGNRPGDLVILATFADMGFEEARAHTPTVVQVDEKNRITDIRAEIPGPADPTETRLMS